MTPQTRHPRSAWPRLLSALPAAEVKQLAASLAADYTIEDLVIPQSGLGLLQLRDSALADAYFLGEIPIAQAHVRLTANNRQPAEGAARVLDDRAKLARAIAVLDAILAAPLAGAEAVAALLERGWQRIAAQEAERRGLLNATRVDFSLLGTDEDDDDV
ncbi:MAG: phosphonate C-P lyase system protein PhnG [Betaproteobacteria bacterium]|nr:phosphonate C-P lyase system protein PhnG [Betaproteobacteria bacterium]